jgi:PAS domain S-box-containing protein
MSPCTCRSDGAACHRPTPDCDGDDGAPASDDGAGPPASAHALPPLLQRQLDALGLARDRPPDAATWAHLLDTVTRAYDECAAQSGRQHDRLAAILSSLGDGLIVADPDGRLLTMNPAAERILGWRADEVFGDHLADVASGWRLRDRERRANIRQLRAALGDRLPARCDDARWVDRERRDVDVSWLLTPLVEDGAPAGSVVVFRDIREHRAVVSRLQHSEARFRAAFESSALGMLRVERDGRIVECNRALQGILGFNPAAPPRRVRDLLHPDDRRNARVLFEELMDGRRDRIQGEFRLLRHDGRELWCSTALAPVTEPDGQRLAAIATIEDLSDRKRLEVDLRQAQKLEAIGLLAAGVAHEINTPIQFVGDNLQFLTDAFAELTSGRAPDHRVAYLRDEVPRALTETRGGVERVATIVRALKGFARPLEHHQLAASNLDQALLDTLTVARHEIRYVADVVTELGNLPPVRCHLASINQVFLNLIVNAAHAIGERHARDGQRGCIRVRSEVVGERVRIAISDDGCGIPPEIGAHVFDPFFTTKPVGKGTGQGLAIVRSVIDKHGGSVRFESQPGRGTTFFVELPIAGVVEPALEASA